MEQVGPRRDPWTVAVHAGPDDARLLGGGVVIDEWRVLTCAHVVPKQSAVWVAFPKAGVSRSVRRQVSRVRAAPDVAADVAVLELAEPVPQEVTPARLLCPEAADLVGERWWAFGFPQETWLGSDAHGVVGAALSYGWVRLETESRYVVKPGFSGTGIWSPRYEAVVGLVGQARSGGDRAGDALAVTLHQIDQELPAEKLAALAAWSVAAAGESALAAWGWTLAEDEEAGRHWRPRARGVSVESEAGWRFRGRTAALTRLVEWLDRPTPDGRVLVVTGSPGVGKSAVLGRLVTTADAGIRAALPADDRNVKATVGSVACVVHAKGKTALDVATEIARAAAVRIPGQVRDLVPALVRRLADRPGRRFNVVVDALDEATSPQEARLIVQEILLPLARSGPEADTGVIVGTRRRDGGGDLLAGFGPDPSVVDLDTEEFFAQEDLAAYAQATLQLVGAEQPGNPYADPALAMPVAARIAKLAQRNFLVAGLVARRHGEYDEAAVSVTELDFPSEVDDALAAYVARLPPSPRESQRLAKVAVPPEPVPAALVLTALAHAEAPGLTLGLWRIVLTALDAKVDIDDLADFADSAAANFLIEASGEGPERQYRLFHQALNDALLRDRERLGIRAADERAIAEALIEHGRSGGWADTNPYLWRSLSYHADRAGLLDVLLREDEYLLHADLLRLIPLADRAMSDQGQARARLLRLTPHAVTADPAERTALFSVTSALEGIGADFAPRHPAPYRVRWAEVTPRTEWAGLSGHTGRVTAVCAVAVDDRELLASGSDDSTIRLWDPVTTGQVTVLSQDGPVAALFAMDLAGQTLLASSSYDQKVRLWDPVTGRQVRTIDCPYPAAQTVCAVKVGALNLLASINYGPSVWLWDLHTGRHVQTLEASASVLALCTGRADGMPLVITAGVSQSVLWEPVTGKQVRVLDAGAGALCTIEANGLPLLVLSRSSYAELREFPSGRLLRRIHVTHDMRSLCAVRAGDRILLGSAGADHMVRLWELPASSRQLQATSTRAVNEQPDVDAICIFPETEGKLLACASRDGKVVMRRASTGEAMRKLAGRLHSMRTIDVDGRPLLVGLRGTTEGTQLCLVDPEDGHDLRLLDDCLDHLSVFSTLSVVTVAGRAMLAAMARGEIILWDPATGRSLRRRWLRNRSRQLHLDGSAICELSVGGGILLASSAHLDRTIRLWEPTSRVMVRELVGHVDPVTALCSVPVDGTTLLASAGDEQVLRLWDPVAGSQVRVLKGHDALALHAMEVAGRVLLASCGTDRTVRLWDPGLGKCVLTVPIHHLATCLASAGDTLIIGLETGMVSIMLWRELSTAEDE